ncbi:hypothetical protein EPYR_04009 (plasmid) [Erwinia pyrifoliae DSM 12163]|nr:hypothetical protein EPYR_04009 [Erwinia pyrifoliae DSM 12163]
MPSIDRRHILLSLTDILQVMQFINMDISCNPDFSAIDGCKPAYG